jgi:hypothetical protein
VRSENRLQKTDWIEAACLRLYLMAFLNIC